MHPFRIGILCALVMLGGCSQRLVNQVALGNHHAAVVPQPKQPPEKSYSDEEEPHADSPEAAARFLTMQRWQGPGPFPVERYLRARNNVRGQGRVSLEDRRRISPASLTQSQAGFGTSWQALGPGNVGGRVRALAIDPNNASSIYAASATGGVWHTTDAGQTWFPLTDFLPVLSTTSLVMDPTNSQTLYLGTGEYQLWGNGIYKTTDGGTTWNELAATDNIVSSEAFSNVNQIAIPATRSSHLYAATGAGLFVSLDGGTTWNAPIRGSTCNSVVARGDQPTDIVLAACGVYDYASESYLYSVYRNTDAAGTGTWQVVQSDPMMSTSVLAIAPSSPGTIYCVSVTSDDQGLFPGALYAVFRSTAGGDAGTWAKRADTSNPDSITANILSYPNCDYGTSKHNGQDGYNLVLAVDPTNPDTLFVGGVDLFRSDDGGLTFGFANYGGNHYYTHQDQHAMAFAPGYDGKSNQTFFVGNDGGVFRTDTALGPVPADQFPTCNSTTSGVSWMSLNHDFATTQFYFGTILPGGATYFGGTQDNGTPIGSDTTGVNGWTDLYGGDGGQVMADPIDTRTLFYEYINLSLRKSTDGGLTNVSSINGITESPDDFNFINNYAYDPSDPLKMYTGGSQLWRTVDGAKNWTAASAPISNRISVEAVSPNDRNRVYFGTDSGAFVYRTSNALTTDGNTVWASGQLTSSGYGFISSIAFDAHFPARVYATISTFRNSSEDAQVYRSDNQGETWTPIGNGPNGLQDVPVSALLVDPDDSSTLYVGTDIGLFASFDGGNTWTQAAAPFADAVTTTLRIEYEGTAKLLYVFTFGRGVWKLNLNGNPTCTYALSTNSITATGEVTQGSLTVSAPPGCPWSARNGSSFTTIESPATGSGPGEVFYNIGFNGGAPVRTDTFYVQDLPVTVTQDGSASPARLPEVSNDDLSNPRVVNFFPFGDYLYSYEMLTSSANDPVHSCTGSADFSTAWYKLTAPMTGTISISAIAQAFGYYGSSGLVITAYPLQGTTLGAELGCATMPTEQGSWTTLTAQFQVTAGQNYALEFSVPNTQVSLITLTIALDAGLTITPAVTQLSVGGVTQLTANVTGAANTGVRWTNSPAQIGSISPTGLYSAPAAVDRATAVTITAQSFASPSTAASATINVTQLSPAFSANGIVNAASFQNGSLAPGEMVTIFGTSLGPVQLAGLQLDASGNVATSIGGTQVTFDGVAAPMVYAVSGQVAAIVPYEVAGKASTQVVVAFNGADSPAVTMPVTDASPALFTSNSSGLGQAAIVNQDGSTNGPTAGARPGSIVALYGTGQGQTIPAGADGTLAVASALPAPVLPVTAQVGLQDAAVLYAGAAPGLVAGIFQINIRVPSGLQPGYQPVVVTVGSKTSQANVTMHVFGP